MSKNYRQIRDRWDEQGHDFGLPLEKNGQLTRDEMNGQLTRDEKNGQLARDEMNGQLTRDEKNGQLTRDEMISLGRIRSINM